MPVAVEHPVKRLQILGGRDRGLFRIRALVDVPVGLEAVVPRGGLHELPRPLGAGLGQRVRLEAALDDRDVGEVERQAFGAEDVLNHRQVLRPAREAFLHVVAQPAAAAARPRRGPCAFCGIGTSCSVAARSALTASSVAAVGVRLRERGDRQQLVDRGRFGLGFREAVALSERGDLVRVDAVDQPIEMLPHPGVGPRPVRGLEQHVNGAVELDPGAVEVAQLELAFAGVEVLLRGGDEGGDRVGGGRLRRGRRDGRGRLRRRGRAFLRLGVGPARRRRCQNGNRQTGERRWHRSTSGHLGAPARASAHTTCRQSREPC